MLAAYRYQQDARRFKEARVAEHGTALDRKLADFTAEVREQTVQISQLMRRIEALQHAPKSLQISTAGAQPCQQQAQRADQISRLIPPEKVGQRPQPQQQHKLAVIIPYRDREAHLLELLPQLHSFLKAQDRDYTIFILEQTQQYRFNRGVLLNAGVLLLDGSDYDYFIFHDVDTIPTQLGSIPYEFPAGLKPLHLTPPGYHPNVMFEDFFGGISAWTREHMAAVNGYGTVFWGWGREDDNMRIRLQRIGRWPPQQPSVPKKGRHFYFQHQSHEKAPEVRVRSNNGEREFFEVNPDVPYGDTLIISSQPQYLQDRSTGLNTTRFWVKRMQPWQDTIKITVDLYCNKQATSWCEG
ncbi:hypothetical protein WJX72_001249 [[Myrmecia] bisecta]|uniref:Uncharacterized protein n=1 Tax=[Myrmecia] bisecta TaxID=41462 RepID=A0AAW1R532_9CHLO